MYSLGQDSSAEKLQKMMSAVDKDGDKKIDWEEFEAWSKDVWDEEGYEFLQRLAEVKASDSPTVLRGSSQRAWLQR